MKRTMSAIVIGALVIVASLAPLAAFAEGAEDAAAAAADVVEDGAAAVDGAEDAAPAPEARPLGEEASPLGDETVCKVTGLPFERQSGGTYDGIPLFCGHPECLENYLNCYMDYIGLDGMTIYAFGQRGDYALRDTATYSNSYTNANYAGGSPTLRGRTVTWEQPNKGKVIPGTPQFDEGVQGAPGGTDFPALYATGSTWNKELAYEIGAVEANEHQNSADYDEKSQRLLYGFIPTGIYDDYMSTTKFLMTGALGDLRVNPLSGRFDESYSEDPYLTSIMNTQTAHGMAGTALPESEDGFWIRTLVNTKHFTNYNAQWFRMTGDYQNSVRGLMEYQARGSFRGFAEGAFAGVMLSYGRTNGVPNAISTLKRYLEQLSPQKRIESWDDGGGEGRMFGGSTMGVSMENDSGMGNEYTRTYVPERNDQMLLMTLAGVGGQATNNYEISDALRDENIRVIDEIQGIAGNPAKYGIAVSDLRELAKSEVTPLVRAGILNKRDANNMPENYPFSGYLYQNTDAAKGATYNYSTQRHKDVALQAAQEATVLLKNDGGALPLAKTADFVVAGFTADSRSKSTYSVATPSRAAIGDDRVGLTPLQGISAVSGQDAAEKWHPGNKEIKIKADNGKYWTTGASSPYNITAAADQDAASVYEVHSWGQAESVNLLDKALQRFVRNAAAVNAGVAFNANDFRLDASNLASGYSSGSAPSNTLMREYEQDGKVRFVSGGISTALYNTYFETLYWESRYIGMSNGETGALAQTGILANQSNAASLRSGSTLFAEEVVKEAGETVPGDADYAIVVVTVPYKLATGEGSDRMDMSLGKENYELIDNVAAKYPGKTIVVLRANYPMEMERAQNNPNVAGIVFQAYAGEYDGYALGQILFGDATPTGRLSSTWYKSMEPLPEISKYVVGNSIWRNVGGAGLDRITYDQLSPKYTVDMVNGDPYETGLTYMFASDGDVTYEFGYGLGYSSFGYSNLSAPGSVGTEPFAVSFDLTNTGSVRTAEVAQAYIAEENPEYGDYASKKKLAAFEKVWLDPGETKTVSMTIDPADFAVWDTNRSDFTVAGGAYALSVGRSSKDFRLTASIAVNAGAIGLLDASGPVNVFNRTFASNNLAYSEISLQNTIDALKNKELFDSQHAVKSKGAGSWAAIKNMDLTNVSGLAFSVASQFEAGGFEVRLDSPAGQLLATVAVPKTEPAVTYLRDSGGVRMYSGHSTEDWVYPGVATTELQYADVRAEIVGSAAGVHDIYLVFGAPDLRVATMQAEYSADAGDADRSALLSLAESAGMMDARVFETGSWAAAAAALDGAEAALADIAATQGDIDAAAGLLRAALEGLAVSDEYGDLYPLIAKLAEIAAMDGSIYTRGSWGSLMDVAAEAWQYVAEVADGRGAGADASASGSQANSEAAGDTGDTDGADGADGAGASGNEGDIGAMHEDIGDVYEGMGGANGADDAYGADSADAAGNQANSDEAGNADGAGDVYEGMGGADGADDVYGADGAGAPLESLADIPGKVADLLMRLAEAVAALELSGGEEPGAPGEPALMAGGIYADEPYAELFVEKIPGGEAPSIGFTVRVAGFKDVGTVNLRASYRLDAAEGIEFSLPAALQGKAWLRVDEVPAGDDDAPPLLEGYATYSVYIMANSGEVFSLGDGAALLKAAVRLKGIGQRTAALVISHLDITYDIEPGVGAVANATIQPAAAASVAQLFSWYDVDRDGGVTLADVDAVRRRLGAEQGGGAWGDPADARCDLDESGGIDIADLTLVIAKYESLVI
jgi:beta-glucosidase-like glycosyl hydrolase